MLPEIALEGFRFFDRSALEGLQFHSRYLRDLVNVHARTLPLRNIHEVVILDGDARFRKTEDQLTQRFIANHESDEAYIDILFGRVNNSYIHRLTLSFRPENRLLLYHLRSRANHLQCHVRALRIDATAERIDYGLVDFLGVHLKPQVFETSMTREFREDYSMLFTCNALRGNVKHLVYELYGPPAPDCVFLELFGVGVIQTCTIVTEVDPRPWIGTFVKMFEMAKRGTDIVHSVTLLHLRFFKGSPSRQSAEAESLGQPRLTDVSSPHSDFIKKWSRDQHHFYGTLPIESNVAELFVVENAVAAKKLELYVWTVEQVRYGQASFHNVFLLQVVDM